MKLIIKVVFAVPLLLVAIVFYQSSTVAQVSKPPREVPQERCLFGYPDRTYKGDRPVTRYEFAAGMNACLKQVNQLLPVNRVNTTRADFEAVIKRQQQLNCAIETIKSASW